MLYIITGKRVREIRSRSSETAAECMTYGNDMVHQGFAIVSIVDSDCRPVSLDDVRAEATKGRVDGPEHRGAP